MACSCLLGTRVTVSTTPIRKLSPHFTQLASPSPLNLMSNRTIFQATGSWPLNDKEDPLRGWSVHEIRMTPWPAAEDLYGKLFFYFRSTMTTFIRQIATRKIHFQLFNIDAIHLDQHLEKGAYDRIEVRTPLVTILAETKANPTGIQHHGRKLSRNARDPTLPIALDETAAEESARHAHHYIPKCSNGH